MKKFERIWSIWLDDKIVAKGDGGSPVANIYLNEHLNKGHLIVRNGFSEQSPIVYENKMPE